MHHRSGVRSSVRDVRHQVAPLAILLLQARGHAG
jgi:hypothetical protein